MRIIDDVKLDFNDVLIVPKRSTLKSRSEVSLIREFKFKWSDKKLKGFGIISANMDTTGTFSMCHAMALHNMFTALHKHYDVEKLVDFYTKGATGDAWQNTFYTMGTSDYEFEKFIKVCDGISNHSPQYGPNLICIDIANGYSEHLIDYVKKVREVCYNSILMVGNVVTPEMTEELILSGADIVKVGIGPGSVCTTRKLTGVGYPQLSAIIECADAAHGLGGHITADGGCTSPGDIAKAFGAGADFVMLGGMLAGHDECEGEIVGDVRLQPIDEVEECMSEALHCNGYCYKGKVYCDIKDLPKEAVKIIIPPNAKMKFYGMSSDTAMNKYNGGVANYRASEGKTVEVPYKGSVHKTLQEIEGGVRSACTYTGSKSIKEISKRTTFVRVNNQLNNIFGKA